jgi:hypothetical protein
MGRRCANHRKIKHASTGPFWALSPPPRCHSRSRDDSAVNGHASTRYRGHSSLAPHGRGPGLWRPHDWHGCWCLPQEQELGRGFVPTRLSQKYKKDSTFPLLSARAQAIRPFLLTGFESSFFQQAPASFQDPSCPATCPRNKQTLIPHRAIRGRRPVLNRVCPSRQLLRPLLGQARPRPALSTRRMLQSWPSGER